MGSYYKFRLFPFIEIHARKSIYNTMYTKILVHESDVNPQSVSILKRKRLDNKNAASLTKSLTRIF